jgi:hypothetical protein
VSKRYLQIICNQFEKKLFGGENNNATKMKNIFMKLKVFAIANIFIC